MTSHGNPSRFWVLAALALALSGCRQERPVTFEDNLVHARRWEIQTGVPMDQALADTRWALLRMFGTPDDPALPELLEREPDLASLVSLERVQLAAGGEQSPGGGLYRQLCAHCHGVTGEGRGPQAALQDPYPRDYRMGIFKYKSTRRGSKPTRDDLARLIRHGIAGTSMTPLPDLTDEQLEALVDYVIYLSWRGELERTLLDELALEYDLEEGDRLVDPTLADSDPEKFEEQWEVIDEVAMDIAERWLDAEDDIVEVEVPDDLLLPESGEDLLVMLDGPDGDALLASIERGRQVFGSKVAACAQCHGLGGRGDGQTTDYDDWAKDWTVRVGLNPEDDAALVPLVARGALPPRNIHPRDFQEGIFRGGSRHEDLYRRIMLGIAGTPMPAATLVPGEFDEEDIWHLINYVRAVQVLELPDVEPLEETDGAPDEAA